MVQIPREDCPVCHGKGWLRMRWAFKECECWGEEVPARRWEEMGRPKTIEEFKRREQCRK